MIKDNETMKEFISSVLQNNKGFMNEKGKLKKGYNYLADRFNVDPTVIMDVVKDIRKKKTAKDVVRSQPRPSVPNIITKNSTVNTLIIGDLHTPFMLQDYLEWCKQIEKEYKCNKVIFIGDIIDGHSWSYHETDVDGMSVGDELRAGKKQLREAYKLFPTADVTLGNHDLLIMRKARTAGLSMNFIKSFGEIIEAPKTWKFSYEFVYDNVRYIHGSVGNAFKRAMDSRMSTVQGHLHSQAFVQYSVSEKDAIFGLQIGCGVDREQYAFEYAKPMTKKPIISAGVVLENGTVPMIRLMNL